MSVDGYSSNAEQVETTSPWISKIAEDNAGIDKAGGMNATAFRKSEVSTGEYVWICRPDIDDQSVPLRVSCRTNVHVDSHRRALGKRKHVELGSACAGLSTNLTG